MPDPAPRDAISPAEADEAVDEVLATMVNLSDKKDKT
jgi:hypothetical protein